MTDYSQITEALITGNETNVLAGVQTSLDAGIPAVEVLNLGLINGMDIVGEKMQNGDMFIPEVLMAAKCMSAAVKILKPLLGDDSASAVGKIGTDGFAADAGSASKLGKALLN